MRLILLGVPGTGKGTQAAILSKQWQIPHISTGEILRQAIADKTSLGLKAKAYVEKGDLVPDHLIFHIIRHRLSHSSAQRGWILDGFPSNLSQARFLDELLETLRHSYNRVFSFYVPIDVLVQRLQQRGRSDDNPEFICRRLEVYQEQTAPLIQHYRRQGCLTVINGDRSVEIVSQFLQASFSESSLLPNQTTLSVGKKLITPRKTNSICMTQK
ncbi:adenylate kinase [Umezakia ovalisporum]|jgi:adenylate kinase|uniref:adenylate kinase n=1 Tax=Umezakia ovalisporum TaxID=75695 RepID=UPI0028CB9892|nr:adenylate kinase [Umezakia ovalisporum]